MHPRPPQHPLLTAILALTHGAAPLASAAGIGPAQERAESFLAPVNASYQFTLRSG